jgi:methanogenic corrinoid protein MtbC1
MINDHARLAATAAAINGDSGTLYHIASDLMGEGVPFDVILFDLLVGVERDVGARWQRGDYLVPEEHAATATVETVVSILAGMFDQPSDGIRVVVAAAEGDQHSLPARMIAAYLLYLGFRTSFLGANVLAADMAEYLEADTPDALVLSCAMSNHLIGVRKVIRAAHDAGVPVLVGGRAFGESGEWASLVGADAWAEDPRRVPEILESWEPDPAGAEMGAVDPTPDLLELQRRRSSVLAAAEAAMTGDPSDRLWAELALLLGAVEASLLVEDDSLITGMLDWQNRTLRAHGYEASLVESLRAALEGVSPRAAAALSRAAGDRP